jgi:CubicO group peptidase (beta-lactamase class C family)
MKQLTLILLSLFLLSSCLKDEDLKLKTVTYLPSEQNDGWVLNPVSSENFNMDIFNEVMDAVYSNDDFLLIRSMVIVKDGKLMAETYPRVLTDRDEPHQLWSTTKSFISMLTGIAIDKGYINGVSDSVFTYIPDYMQYAYPELRPLTIEECLTMRSGIDYSNDDWEEEELLACVPDELTRYIVERPMKARPGEEAFYKNSDPQLLVKVVANATKTDFVEFADQHLFSPLGITNYYWSRNKDNTPYGGFGLWLTPRDLAKVGQMLLNNGQYNNRQILSNNYIKAATTTKTVIYEKDYGYLFWINHDARYYFTWGAGGQFLFMVPEKSLVVVITSEPFADEQNTSLEQASYLVEKIMEGVTD